MLARDRDSWFAMNRVYPHMTRAFRALGARGAVLRPVDQEAAIHHRDPRRQPHRDAAGADLSSDGEPKLAATERLRAEGGYQGAILVEDQIDHLRGNENPRVRALLAAWGYVQEEWLKAPLAAPMITAEGFLAFGGEGVLPGLITARSGTPFQTKDLCASVRTVMKL